MTKIQTGTSLEDALLQRIKLIARVDRRSVSDVVAWCVELGLPRLEEELHDRAGKLKEITSAPTKHPTEAHPVKHGNPFPRPDFIGQNHGQKKSEINPCALSPDKG